MTLDDMKTLLRFVAAVKPAQKMYAETPAAWFLTIGDLPLEDAQLAVARLARTEKWIDPCDIVRVVTEAHADRAVQARGGAVAASMAVAVPVADPDDWRGYLRDLRAGNVRPEVTEGAPRPVLVDGRRGLERMGEVARKRLDHPDSSKRPA